MGGGAFGGNVCILIYLCGLDWHFHLCLLLPDTCVYISTCFQVLCTFGS